MSNSWYPRYTGDYGRDTGHLSMIEHGAYTLLLDHHYSTQKPLPANDKQLLRICSAVATDEQAAVMSVINEFFTMRKGGWVNQRAWAEMSKQLELSKKRQEAGRLGGQASATANAQANAATTTTTTTATTKEPQPEPPPKKKEGGKPPKPFKKPKANEVFEYAKSIGFAVDGQSFCDFYESKGWTVGKSAMKDWKAAVRTWRARENESGNGSKPAARPKSVWSLKEQRSEIDQELVQVREQIKEIKSDYQAYIIKKGLPSDAPMPDRLIRKRSTLTEKRTALIANSKRITEQIKGG